MAHDPNVPYSPSSATPEEIAALTPTFAGERVKWTCPRCKATFEEGIEIDRPIYALDVESVGPAADVGLLALICECGTKHSGGEKANCGFAAYQPVRRA
jgi:hypothetical protein